MAAAATTTTAAVDHYIVLGLPSGEEGSKLSEQEIHKAYRFKARELHPDKQRNDANAHSNFLKLQSSYEILKDEQKRKLFDDDLLRMNWEKLRERSGFVVKSGARYQKEEMISRKLKEEIATIVAEKLSWAAKREKKARAVRESCINDGLEKGKIAKVSRGTIAGYQALEDSVLEKLRGLLGDKSRD